MGGRGARLLERDHELRTLSRLIESASRGNGGVALAMGPAGIGKSALLACAMENAVASRMTVLTARGGELERGFGYGVVRQLLEPYMRRLTKNARSLLLSGSAAPAADLLGVEFDIGRSSDDEVGRAGSEFAIVHGLYWLMANIASASPTVVVVDDVHWADEPSLKFLLYVSRRLEGVPLVLILAARPREPGSDLRLLSHLMSEPGLEMLRPAALSQSACGRLLTSHFSEDPAARFVGACHRATRGNPFLISELVSTLVVDGIVPTDDNVERIERLNVQSVSNSMLLRLGSLPAHVTRVARAVAVLGDDAGVKDVAALAEATDDETSNAIALLREAEIFVAGEEIRYIHALVRHAVYADLRTRSLDHARAAAILSDAGAPVARIAAHLMETEPGGDSVVADTLRKAARSALAAGTPELAVALLQRALAEPPDDRERVAMNGELASAAVASGRPDLAAEHLMVLLESTTDPAQRAPVVLMLHQALIWAGRTEEGLRVMERAAAEAKAMAPGVAEVMDAGAILAGLLDLEMAPRVMERARVLRRRVDAEDPPPLILAAALGAAMLDNEAASSVIELAKRTADGWLKAGDLGHLPVLYYIVASLVFAAEFELAQSFLDASIDRARTRGAVPEFTNSSIWRSLLHYRAGSIDRAELDARTALETAEFYGQDLYGMMALAFLIETLIERGCLDEAEVAAERFDPPSGVLDSLHFTFLACARARLALARGETRRGLEGLLASGAKIEQGGWLCAGLSSWRADAAVVYAVLGEAVAAERLIARDVELSRAFGSARAIGVSLRAAGLVSRDDQGLGALEESVAVLRSSGANLELARTQTDLGAMLRRMGRRTDARPPLREGLELAHRCGATALAERAKAELVAAGARPRRSELTGIRSLTASERRVAELAQAGRTNREIAQALYVTTKTVETHLRHVFEKLDIGSRGELPAELEPITG